MSLDIPGDITRPDILFEDNHIIVVNKPVGMLTQGDRTGDLSILELVGNYIKNRDSKPGNVFLGLPHRLDRPVGGILLLAKTSKALSRLSESFRSGSVKKTYLAVVETLPNPPEGVLTDWLYKNSKTNTSVRADSSIPGTKKASLEYRLIGKSRRYWLLEVKPTTGRHHQIRVQLAGLGCPIKGDLKYGARRSEPDGGILLFAKSIEFPHPIGGKMISVESPLPSGSIWKAFSS